jgi:hypothetical protein
MKGPTMPHHNLSPEIIFAGAIWLTAIFIFVMMLIAVFASLRATDKTEAKSRPETELKFNPRIVRLNSKRKTKNRA